MSRRVRKALDEGYLRNLEDKRGKPHRLLPGDPLPDDQVILPQPGELHGCTVAETHPPHNDPATGAGEADRLNVGGEG